MISSQHHVPLLSSSSFSRHLWQASCHSISYLCSTSIPCLISAAAYSATIIVVEYPAGPIVFRSQCNVLNKASYHSRPPSPRDFTSHSPISLSTLEKHPLAFSTHASGWWGGDLSLNVITKPHLLCFLPLLLSGFHNSISEGLTITFTKDSLPPQIQSSLSS